ncbi:hypothetical protein [Rhizobium sullae]|uniref:hypothetical protein n=1 Tax=Rhizobium sullae TaxID=50338 RepID=UPI000B3538C4|nr:hypothetical protein [Rhizobium sullae]
MPRKSLHSAMSARISGRDQAQATAIAFNKIMANEVAERSEKSARLKASRLALEIAIAPALRTRAERYDR